MNHRASRWRVCGIQVEPRVDRSSGHSIDTSTRGTAVNSTASRVEWATDKTRFTWIDDSLAEATSHAIALDSRIIADATCAPVKIRSVPHQYGEACPPLPVTSLCEDPTRSAFDCHLPLHRSVLRGPERPAKPRIECRRWSVGDLTWTNSTSDPPCVHCTSWLPWTFLTSCP